MKRRNWLILLLVGMLFVCPIKANVWYNCGNGGQSGGGISSDEGVLIGLALGVPFVSQILNTVLAPSPQYYQQVYPGSYAYPGPYTTNPPLPWGGQAYQIVPMAPYGGVPQDLAPYIYNPPGYPHYSPSNVNAQPAPRDCSIPNGEGSMELQPQVKPQDESQVNS